MSDHTHSKDKRRLRPARDGQSDQFSYEPPDFAAQMARAEFGRHYVDSERVEQTLKDGEIVFQHRKRNRLKRD